MDNEFHILIVDDEPNIRSGLAKGLAKVANKIETAASVNEGLDKFDAGNFQLVIADVRMPGDRDGLDLISLVQQRKPGTTTIVITAHGRPPKIVTPDAMQRLIDARWPGNVRQLRNVVERVVVTSTSDMITPSDLPAEISRGESFAASTVRTLAEITEAAEKSGIENALVANGHHREMTAKTLGISVRTLHYKMNKYDLH